jgi:hypothetical protein
VEIVTKEPDGRALGRMGTMTASQVRSLAQALLDKADEADRQTWFR